MQQLVGLYTQKNTGRDVAYIPKGIARSENVDWAFVTESGTLRRISYPTDEEIQEMLSLSESERFPFVEEVK